MSVFGDVVRTPRCPVCRQPPMAALQAGGGVTYFCGNDDCSTLTWNPYAGDEQILDTTFLHQAGCALGVREYAGPDPACTCVR